MAEYLAFHYLEPSQLLPPGAPLAGSIDNFPSACAHLLLRHAPKRASRALDLGCAVGRSSFEIARRIPEVIGIDYSKSFIRAAKKVQKKGRLRFNLLEEGTNTRPSFATFPTTTPRKRTTFLSGDALHLPSGLGSFDAVLAANLIDRLPEPKKFLKQILPSLVKPGGIVLLTSPYTWSSEFTPRSRWFKDSFSTIRMALRPSFRLLHRQNLPFLLREHRRKFQFTFSDATIWQRF